MMPGLVVILKTFPNYRALANGIALMGFTCGDTLASHLIRLLIAEFGWRGALLILSALILHRVPLAMTFREPTETTASPPSSAQSPDGTQKKGSLCSTMLRGAFDFSLFKHAPFALFCLAGVLQRAYLSGSSGHIPSFAVEQGHSLTRAAFLSSTQAFSNMSFRVFVMIIANLPGVNRQVIHIFGMLCGIGVVSLLLTVGMTSYWGIVGGVVANGLHMGQYNQ
jgi:cyanate permease